MKPTFDNNVQPTILVDYDWTLFDTTSFINDLWRTIAQSSGTAIAKVTDDGAAFHVDPVLGGYDYEAHISSYGLNPTEMWLRLKEILNDKDYLYPDSAGFMHELHASGHRPSILSFGEEHYQRTKIAPFIGRLSGNNFGIDITVVLERKREHIAKKYPGLQGVLVDDVPNQELPNGFTEIHLDRSLDIQRPRQTKAGFAVSSLHQAIEAIKQLYD